MKKSDIRQSHWLGLVNIHMHAKNYQNIPCDLKILLRFQFLKFCLGEAIYKEIWHQTIQ